MGHPPVDHKETLGALLQLNSLSLLRDTSTDENIGDDEDNKNTGEENGDAHQNNYDSAHVGLELGPDARKLLKYSYLAKWVKYSNSTKVDTDNDVADETESDADNENDIYVPTDEVADDEGADDNENEEEQVYVPGTDKIADDDGADDNDNEHEEEQVYV
jgi:hypothetical protein